MSVYDFPSPADVWKRREAARADRERRDVQRIGRFAVLELADEPRQPDGTREFCALLDAKPRAPR